MLCSGYPGSPEVLPSHPLIEQSPGYGHPYLPSEDTDIEVDHFLWTGDIASEELGPDQEEEAGARLPQDRGRPEQAEAVDEAGVSGQTVLLYPDYQTGDVEGSEGYPEETERQVDVDCPPQPEVSRLSELSLEQPGAVEDVEEAAGQQGQAAAAQETDHRQQQTDQRNKLEIISVVLCSACFTSHYLGNTSTSSSSSSISSLLLVLHGVETESCQSDQAPH